jgi:DNA mismatch endonuclease (patch repair protein)
MRAVRREKTTPELAVARFLGAHGVRFRTNVRSLPGSPDLANKSRRFAVYVHGCFWHRHSGCSRATTPKNNAEFWRTKFEQNVARDRRKEQALRDLGFEVAVVWECETRDEGQLWRTLAGVLAKVGVHPRPETSRDAEVR